VLKSTNESWCIIALGPVRDESRLKTDISLHKMTSFTHQAQTAVHKLTSNRLTSTPTYQATTLVGWPIKRAWNVAVSSRLSWQKCPAERQCHFDEGL